MKIISNRENQQRIQESFDRICTNCSNELRETIQNMSLIITDESNAQSIYSDKYNLFQKAYSDGFGGVKGNISHENERYHLVVLNMNKINEFNLNDCEFDGVFSHELGHIFNENPPREKPVMQGFTPQDMKRYNDVNEQFKKTEQREKETYADYFSKRTNCSQGLISSIIKYINSENCPNRELFDIRIEQLRSEDDLLGTIKIVE